MPATGKTTLFGPCHGGESGKGEKEGLRENTGARRESCRRGRRVCSGMRQDTTAKRNRTDPWKLRRDS